MATDGLWDELSSGDVKNILKIKKQNLNSIANKLFETAIIKAAEASRTTPEEIMKMDAGKTKRGIHDDITLIVFDLKH